MPQTDVHKIALAIADTDGMKIIGTIEIDDKFALRPEGERRTILTNSLVNLFNDPQVLDAAASFVHDSAAEFLWSSGN